MLHIIYLFLNLCGAFFGGYFYTVLSTAGIIHDGFNNNIALLPVPEQLMRINNCTP